MAALTSKRPLRRVNFSGKDLPATAATYYQGGLVGWDTSVGRVVKGAASTTFLPIGTVVEDTIIANNGDLLSVNLFREVSGVWMVNLGADPVVAADRGSLCYVASDQEVAHSDSGNTRSVAGRVWDVDTLKGVLVEPRFINDFKVTSPGLDS
jgi:hypothetical protein